MTEPPDFYSLPTDLRLSIIVTHGAAANSWRRAAEEWLTIGHITDYSRKHMAGRLDDMLAMCAWMEIDPDEDTARLLREAIALPAKAVA